MKFLLSVLVLSLLAGPACAQVTDLFISEYIEGSVYNKALEIYNGTDDSINLGNYSLELYANGSTVPTTITLGNADLNPLDVFVIANPSASVAILGHTDLTSSALNFNGNDALVLRRDSYVIDRLGQVGLDPGASWNCASGSTLNSTLRRQAGVCSGDPNLFDQFNPCTEYDFYPSDTFDDLGRHSNDCWSVGSRETSWGSLKANFK
ncbi:MAG: lamin tail domain-containing protein [Gemmatimonadales bacterium]|nr:lamin tail domain-containing protein [Gemmatimonadales bacterium]